MDEQSQVEARGGRRWMNSSPWRLEEVDGGDEHYPVESRFAVRHTPPDGPDPRFGRSAPIQVCFVRFTVRHTPPDQQDPRFDCRRSVSSVLRYARPLPMNRIPLRTWSVEHKAVSSVVRYARPRFHRLFRTSPPDEHDTFRCLPGVHPPDKAGGGRRWMNSSPWRLEEVDGGDEQYPVEFHFAVSHTPPD